MLYNIFYKNNKYILELDEYSSILNIKHSLIDILDIKDIDFYLSNNIINFDNNKLLLYYKTNNIFINPKIKGGGNKITILYVLFIIFILILSLLVISLGLIPFIYILLNIFLNLFKTFIGNYLVCYYNKISLYKFIKIFINILLFFLLILLVYYTLMFSILLLVLLVKKKVFYEDIDNISKYYKVANTSTIVLVVIFMLIYTVYRSDRIFLKSSRKIFGKYYITKYTILLIIEIICKGISYAKKNYVIERPVSTIKKYMDEIIQFTVIKENKNINNSVDIIDYEDDDIDCLDTHKSLYIIHKGCSQQFFNLVSEQFEKINNKIKDSVSSMEYADEKSYLKILDSELKNININNLNSSKISQLLSMADLIKDRDALIFLMKILDKNKYSEVKKTFDNSMFISKLYGINMDFILGIILKYILCNSLRFIINTDTVITEYGDLYDNIDILLSGFRASAATGTLYFILIIILIILGLLNVY